MSLLTYIASDKPLSRLDAGDDVYYGEVSVCPFDKSMILDDIYTQKLYCAHLEWEYSEERADKVMQYITNQFKNTSEIELWHIWLGGLIEDEKGEYRPKLKAFRTREAEDVDWDDWKLKKVHKKEMLFSQLNHEILKEFFFGNSLSQRCLIIKKQ